MAPPLRVGLVGCGGVGARHARVLGAFPDVDLVAVHDPDGGLAAAVAERHGASRVGSLAALLAGRPDAVWLCVPPFAHGEPERALVRAGVPFFIEKPLAADLAVAEGVAGLVAGAGLPTATGYHWRYLDTVDAARAALAGRPVRLVDARWWGGTPPPAWWRRLGGSGGQVVEQATHVLDVLRVLAGEVVEVHGGLAPSTAPDRDVPDATAALLRFAGGAVGTVSTSCVLPALAAAGLEVVADGVWVHLTEAELRTSHPDGDRRAVPAVDPRTAVDRGFVDVLLGRPAPSGLVDVAEALRTHRLAWAVTEATRSGGTVRVGSP